MTIDRSRLRPGMDVAGPDGGYIGNVANVGASDIAVNRPETSTIHVPVDAITWVDNGRVILNVSAGDVDLKNWPHDGAFVGAVSTRPGPQGPGIPSGRPGWPTFEGTGVPYEPGPGASNLVDDTEPGELDQAARGIPGTGTAGAGGASSDVQDPGAERPHMGREGL